MTSEPLTDFKTHYIEGYALMAEDSDGYFNVPLFSQITDNLWTGGNPVDLNCLLEEVNEDSKHGLVTVRAKFDAILSLYPWEPYPIPVGVDYKALEFYDGANVPTDEQLEEAVSWAHERLSNGLRVLIQCQAGLNRSGLVAALVLRREGMTSKAAIELLREKRCSVVLCNRIFQEYLLELDEEPFDEY